jgi:hypothetical protein
MNRCIVTPAMSTPFNPNSIAQAGQEIYKRKFQEQYEKDYRGKYAAINVRDESAVIGDTAEQALDAALKADPKGVFHLVRVGFARSARGPVYTKPAGRALYFREDLDRFMELCRRLTSTRPARDKRGRFAVT